MPYYGLLSNAYTAALVSPEGSVDWLAFPRFDSPSVFARLLDERRGGSFRLEPPGGQVVERRYVAGSNVLTTLWAAPGGAVRSYDYLPVGRTELRRVVHADGPVVVDVDPAFHYGQIAPAYVLGPDGGIFARPGGAEALLLRVRGHGAWRREGEHTFRLEPGRYELILRYSTDPAYDQAVLDRLSESPEAAMRREIQFWRSFPVPDYSGPHADALLRSLQVLHALTFRPTGAIVAAPTTSLPESPGDARQWDYRYVWVRDAAYAAEAFLLAGDRVAARRYLEFMLNSVDLGGKPFRRPFTQVDGTPVVGEEELLWLAGHQGSRPVRAGNAATGQLQLDIEGDFLWAVGRYLDATGDSEFVRYHEQALMAMVDWVARQWNAPDASLWEFRGQDRHYTHSKLMCWVALTEGARLAALFGHHRRAQAWREEAERVRRSIDESAVDPVTSAYGQSYGSSAPDASLLLLPLYGFVDARDPRFDATLERIERELRVGPWVYRYRSDMLGDARHPFVLGSFWLARVLGRRGEWERAWEVIDGALAHATDLGLLGEHADSADGSPRGNFPQLFSHAGVVTALLELGAAGVGVRSAPMRAVRPGHAEGAEDGARLVTG
ncbi:MAG: glycoside hydrolase family 15 protein [Firmicutes bacterium]|nr:glycoside hydrolase family 15 protein [Bacillota bacterium]